MVLRGHGRRGARERDPGALVAAVVLRQEGAYERVLDAARDHGAEGHVEAGDARGLPGAFAILHADNGRLSFTKFANDNAMTGIGSGLNYGFNFNQLYSSTPGVTSDYLQSTASPKMSSPSTVTPYPQRQEPMSSSECSSHR